ncbi:MAG TPA: O-antigen ligase family protein [Thermoanaerobaculia bacterium]|jgi:O-antigen ligase|nr:O-antigen ligase family protein [Thermoanaerobaculia bacterium]
MKPAAAAVPTAPPFAVVAMWALIYTVPLLVVPGLHEAFRAPKLLIGELLALASLLGLATVLKGREIDWKAIARRPEVAASIPLLLLAVASLATTAHPLHVRDAVASLGVGTACLIGWTGGFDRAQKERFLIGSLVPAGLLSLLAVLQFHQIWEPLRFAGIGGDSRLGVTALAGNPGDLGAFLVLPCLIGAWCLPRLSGKRRIGAAAAVVLCLYALVVTQTLAALAAFAAGALVFALVALPRRRVFTGLAAVLILGGLALVFVAPLRSRVANKVQSISAGDWNALLTGRLDGWRAALLMWREHPWAGVGHGAYRPEFVPAKLKLAHVGTRFFEQHNQPTFANAHNEFLEVPADLGWPGALALAWGLGVIGFAALRHPDTEPADRALFRAGLVALAVLSAAYFPFRIALVAFPALLFLSWGLDSEEEA